MATPAPTVPEGPTPPPTPAAEDPAPPAASPERAEPPPPSPTPAPAPAPDEVAAVHKASSPKPEPRKWEHKGFAVDGRVGTHGCRRSLCSSSHGSSPGVRLEGFVGGNIRGWVDLGVSGGWGTFGNRVAPGTNALSLYGVNPYLLQAAAAGLGTPLPFAVGNLTVNSAKLRTARVGPLFRIHFVPRGRMIAYAGTGVGYSLFRARYNTIGGDVRIDLHGVDVPIQAGLGVHVTEHVAVGAQFDYFWARYGLASLHHPEQTITMPVTFLDQAAQTQGTRIRDTLPHIWSVGFGVRVRV